MKVYISVDMEGISGVAAGRQLRDTEYGRFRKIMTQDVNAAIRGACEAGATDILVNDAHGNMCNILVEDLDPRARLISGSTKHLLQMEGIDETFDAALFVGYHAREGSPDGIINHTIMGGAVTEIRLNGRPIGETGINAAVAGSFGVPVVFISGDDVVCAEARDFLGNPTTVEVKKAHDRFTANLIVPSKAQEMIAEGVKEALGRYQEVKPYLVGETTFEVDLKITNMAHMACLFPSVKRLGTKTVQVSAENAAAAYKQLWGVLVLAYAAMNGYF
ncbi:MAG: M55 family metallopeptidase [Symbiobacteriaceae bacterium]|nr:M55 family metallopeptidase [Symbiobacteriaceae bacterium]